MRIKLTAVVSVALALCMLLGIGVTAADKPETTGYNQALLNICDFGAIPNDGLDDTQAFQLTVSATSEAVYLPAGTYNISEGIVVKSSMLVGAGPDKTVIVADMESPREPIIWAGDNSQIRDITIKFADGCVTGDELAGERVGIMTSSKLRRLCRQAAITNVRIQNVGTGIYAPVIEVLQQKFPNTDGAIAFSVTFEAISVIDFSYRGISMMSDARTGNVWRNIYLSSGKYEANTALFFGKEESEFAFTELTIADSKLKNGVRFIDAPAAQITNLTFDNVELVEDNTGYLYCEQSDVTVNGLNFINSAPKNKKQAFIRLGDAAYRGLYYAPARGYLHIYNMNILNPDQENITADQYMISRVNKYLNDYTVDIDNLRVVAPDKVKKVYEEFNIDDRNIDLTIMGEKK